MEDNLYRYNWRIYKEKAYELIGQAEADELKEEGSTWIEVLDEAKRIHRNRELGLIPPINYLVPTNSHDKILKLKAKGLIGPEKVDALKTEDNTWQDVYDEAKRMHYEQRQYAILFGKDEDDETSEEDEPYPNLYDPTRPPTPIIMIH